MSFARQTPMPQRIPDLSRFVDTPRQRKDPCFECTLPFCDDRLKECKFVNTSFQVVGTDRYSRPMERERQELIAELIEDGVIDPITMGGHIKYTADTETPEERQRRSKREYMRRIRGKNARRNG